MRWARRASQAAFLGLFLLLVAHLAAVVGALTPVLGLAGGLLVHKILLCTPRMFTFVKSIEVVVMVVLGGMGSISGSIVAAAGLTLALEWLRGLDQYRMVIYSLLLIVLMLVRPAGLFGTREVWDRLPRWLGRRRAGGGTP